MQLLGASAANNVNAVAPYKNSYLADTASVEDSELGLALGAGGIDALLAKVNQRRAQHTG